jgi:alginate O-acetyltransferase complex protein AlgI
VIFASKAFLVFLPVVLIGYHLVGRRAPKYAFLLAASWVFYALVSPQYLWVLLLLTGIDYAVGLRLDREFDDRRRRRWLALSVVSNLGLLAAFKYTPFVYDNGTAVARWLGYDVPPRAWDILLPLGISFHTFQGISYTVDVYRRRIPAVRSVLDYALFVAFFPQMAAGPIVRAAEFLPQMASPPAVTPKHVADGLRFFMVGLFKKLFIADSLDQLLVGPVFADPLAFTAEAHRWAAVAWAVQIYCDFSGYSDMAVGCAKWFGFEFPANFNLPYLATSITDFWRRWHLSLSTWLRDYLYFPLGGSRHGEARTYLNLLVVFVLCGLWHGATWAWLAYGLLNGLLMGLHRAFDRSLAGIDWADRLRATASWRLLAWLATTAQLLIGLILIRMPDWQSGGALIRSMLGGTSPGTGGVPVWVPLLVAAGLAGHAVELIRSVTRVEFGIPEGVRAMGYAAAVAVLVTLSPGVGKAFIYIQF